MKRNAVEMTFHHLSFQMSRFSAANFLNQNSASYAYNQIHKLRTEKTQSVEFMLLKMIEKKNVHDWLWKSESLNRNKKYTFFST